jgi:hypothetical protein
VSGILLIVLVFLLLAGGLGAVAYFTYQRKLRRAKAIERGLKMVPILIHLPPPSADTHGENRDIREVMREKTSQAEVLYNLIAGTATEGFKSGFYGQRHIALELVAVNNVVHFFVAVPVALVSTITKAVQTAYPGARLEEVEDHNIFNQEGRLAATLGGEMVLRSESSYPIATYAKLERDPMEAVLTAISALDKADGVAVQIMLRPANSKWIKRSVAIADAKRKGRHEAIGFSAMDLAKAALKAPTARREEEMAKYGAMGGASQLELSEVEAIEEKTKHPAFEVLIRVIVSTGSVPRSQQLLRDIATAFALFETPGMNGFKFLPALDVQGLVTAFIFRFFPPELKSNILNSVELATLFHLPDSQFTPTTSVERQQSKQVDGPIQLPTRGLLFGNNEFRGVKKEIRLSPEDRRRHTYILGQTGTGKSTMLENLAVQDMLAGNGFAFIDPHGDSAEKLLSMVPKERAEDIVYFNPADTQYPLGLNLFEFSDPSQKDFLIQETISMLYKLYDPGHTGIIGPRYEHWYRNAALTLMADPNGATFIEIPKVFTDTDYLKQKFKYLKDPTVIDFWTKEMGQTSDYHKSEMLGWFVSKFGAFQNNEMMRNIIGQTKSAFNLRDIMDNKKILIVNLSKGRVGELNSQLLGMIFVIKFQAAAMSRADMPEDQRSDFALYVDEFQNFSTDSFASILSEARKYRLNLIVANQFVGQLSDEIREAVFGNIGTIVAHRMGPEDAEFMVKQFAPVFDVSDLVNIPNYNAVMRLMIGGLPSQPFTLHDTPPLAGANQELGMAIKQLSAAKFGRSKNAVEADILDRMSGGSLPAPVGEPVPAVAPTPDGAAGENVAGENVAGGAAGGTGASSGAMPAPAAAPVLPTPGAAMGAAPVAAATTMAAVAAVPASMPGMSTTPPPIGAPPVGTASGQAAPVNRIASGVNMAEAQAASMDLANMLAGVAPGQAQGMAQTASPVQPGMAAPMPGMTTPPPIGSAPVPLPVQGTAAEVVQPARNTGGQMMAPVSPIIPETNAGQAAEEMAANGAFRPMGSALPMPGDGIVAPPIGAPPVDLDAMRSGAERDIAATAPAQSYAPTTAFLPPQPASGMAGSSLTPPPIGAPPVALPDEMLAPAKSPLPSSAAALSGNPVGDSGTLSFRDITGGKTLPRRAAASLDEVPVMMPGAEPDMLPILAEPAPGPMRPTPTQAARLMTPLGSGVAMPDDPYANIDVLGDLNSPVLDEPVPVEGRPFVAQAGVPEVTGEPLPGDPYAEIDVLGAAPEPQVSQVPLTNAELEAQPQYTEPMAAAPAPVAAPVQEPEPEYASEPQYVSQANYEPEPAADPEPLAVSGYDTQGAGYGPVEAESVYEEQAPELSSAQPEPVYAPEANYASAMAEEPQVYPVPQPRPRLQRPRTEIQQAPRRNRGAAELQAAQMQAAQMQAAEAGLPPEPEALADPFVMPPMPAAAPPPMPEVLAGQPPVLDEPVLTAQEVVGQPRVEPQPTEAELIHFVDPNAQAVLQQPTEVPEAVGPDGKPSLNGLPQGVQLVEAPAVQTGAVSVPAAPAAPGGAMAGGMPAGVSEVGATMTPAPVPVPAAAVEPGLAAAAAVPVPAPAAVTRPAVQQPSAPVAPAQAVPTAQPGSSMPAALAVPLEQMAATPPPIGAPPVALAPAPAPAPAKVEQPVIEPQEAQIAKAAGEAPVPELNASLAEALEKHPADLVPAVEAPARGSARTELAAAQKAPAKAKAVPSEGAGKAANAVAADEATTGKAVVNAARPAAVSEARPAAETKGKPAPASDSQTVPTAAEQIWKAESEIDHLLSVSLIQPEASSGTHHRLPEPVAPTPDETGVDLELNAEKQEVPQAPTGTPAHMMAQHHGLKVIQPLEPIVPAKEQFAKELAAMQVAATGQVAPAAPGAAAGSAAPAQPVGASMQSAQDTSKAKAAPAASAPAAQTPTVPVPTAAQAVAAGASEPAAPSVSAPVPTDDFERLPQAESLAANDVAKAREAHEQQLMQQAAPVPASASVPEGSGTEVKVPKPLVAAAQAAKPEPASEDRKKRKRLGKEKPDERIESEAEAEHNKPSAAAAEVGTMTGKLIMPTGEKPAPEPTQPKQEKPKKLAPGEVYVDEHGNVMIGE